MNTSILTVVLTGALLAGQNAAPTWQTSYGQAQQRAAEQKKPLVVVFGSGANAWEKVVQAESATPEITKMMADSYVCVYVDTTSPAGKKVAQDFGIAGDRGMVISDRAGTTQAFWHQGDLSSQNMVRYLKKYADPQVVIGGTETASNSARTSFYGSSEAEGHAAPVSMSSSPSSSYCPSCNNVRGRR